MSRKSKSKRSILSIAKTKLFQIILCGPGTRGLLLAKKSSPERFQRETGVPCNGLSTGETAEEWGFPAWHCGQQSF